MKNKPYPLYEIPDVWTLRELVNNGREKGEFVTAFYRGKHNDQPITFGECRSSPKLCVNCSSC